MAHAHTHTLKHLHCSGRWWRRRIHLTLKAISDGTIRYTHTNPEVTATLRQFWKKKNKINFTSFSGIHPSFQWYNQVVAIRGGWNNLMQGHYWVRFDGLLSIAWMVVNGCVCVCESAGECNFGIKGCVMWHHMLSCSIGDSIEERNSRSLRLRRVENVCMEWKGGREGNRALWIDSGEDLSHVDENPLHNSCIIDVDALASNATKKKRYEIVFKKNLFDTFFFAAEYSFFFSNHKALQKCREIYVYSA